jgi:colanic acid/amylovoran biosynthesis glycosyltransferase
VTGAASKSDPAALPLHPSRVSRLGYLVPEFPSQTHAFFWREVQALRQFGVDVRITSSRKPDPAACRHPFADQARRETHYLVPPHAAAVWQLVRRPLRTLAAVGYLRKLSVRSWRARVRGVGLLLAAAELVRHARGCGYAHVHVHSCADTAHVAALAKILGGLSYSLTLHGDLPVYGTDHDRKMAGAAFVGCVTRQLRAQVAATVGLPESRLPVIWMGVNTDEYTRPAGDPAAGALLVVTVARLNPAKGHVYALRAIRAAVDHGCDVRYEIAGEGPHRGEIEAEVSRLALGDRVRLLGTLGEQEVLALLRRADAFLLPSVGLGEAAPVSVMEAMSCGLPVVSSVIGGTPDMIGHGVDGFLVRPADVDGLTECLTRLARDPQLRQRIGAAARARAVRQFDYRQTGRQLLDAITASGNP